MREKDEQALCEACGREEEQYGSERAAPCKRKWGEAWRLAFPEVAEDRAKYGHDADCYRSAYEREKARADAAERERDAWHEEAKNLEKFHDRSCGRAEAAEAAQAKLTEALRAAYAVNMRMLALYSPDMVGSKSGHSLMRSICEVNTTIDAILTSAASAPQDRADE